MDIYIYMYTVYIYIYYVDRSIETNAGGHLGCRTLRSAPPGLLGTPRNNSR